MPDRRHLRRKLIEAEVPVSPGTLGYFIKQHLRSLEVRNYSPATVRERSKDLRYFVVWTNERAITRPEEITVAVLERYQRFMFYSETAAGRRLSFRVQSARLQALRVFFRWLVRQHIIEMSPAELLELPRPEYRLPKNILTVSEVESILSTCDVKTAIGLRDRAVIELLYSSGLRRFEVVNLKVWDVNTDERIVVVRQGKGKKDRIIPMGERAALWILKYVDEARPAFATEPDSGHLFLTSLRQPLVPERVSDIVRAAAREAGLPRTISAHIFRHTMATMMLDGGADVRFVQAMLGHAHLSTTEIYTRVAIRKLKEVHEYSHPGAKLERSATPQGVENESDPTHDEVLSRLAAEDDDSDSESGAANDRAGE